MKIRVTMKDTDTLNDTIEFEVQKAVSELPMLSHNERRTVGELRQAEVRALAGQWFRYGEYVTIEIDTDAKTAIVCRV
jgi:hypothetical protein